MNIKNYFKNTDEIKNINILITGALGFIGFNLVLKLNELGFYNLILVDNINSLKYKRLSKINFIDYYQKDEFIKIIRDNNLVKRYRLDKINFIFHQGACTNTLEDNIDYLIQNNYEYSKDLLLWANNYKIPFIYASSASIYGNTLYKFNKNKIEPLNYYALSKFLFDNFVLNNIDNFSISIIGLRYFNVYGFHEEHKLRMSSVIFHFFNQALNNNCINIFEGSNNFFRDFILVDDVVNINLLFFKIIMYGKASIKSIYDCGTGKSFSFLDIANIFKDHLYNLTENKIEIKYIPFPTDLKNKYQILTKANNKELIKLFKHNKVTFKFTSIQKGIYLYLNKLIKEYSIKNKDK